MKSPKIKGLLINDVITGGGGGALQQVPNVKAECHSMNQVPSYIVVIRIGKRKIIPEIC